MQFPRGGKRSLPLKINSAYSTEVTVYPPFAQVPQPRTFGLSHKFRSSQYRCVLGSVAYLVAYYLNNIM